MTPLDIESRLRATALLRELPADRTRAFAHASTHRHFREGEALWRAGDTGEHMVLVLRGLVQVTRHTEGGSAAIFGLFGPREWVGLVAVLKGRTYPADASASAEVVEALFVRAEPVVRAMSEDPSLAMAFNRALCDHAEALRARIDVLSAGPVPSRLATLLLHLAERFGDVGGDGVTRIPLALSRVSLARLVSARVETVIRAASDWQKRGILRTGPEGFELPDVDAIRRIAVEH